MQLYITALLTCLAWTAFIPMEIMAKPVAKPVQSTVFLTRATPSATPTVTPTVTPTFTPTVTPVVLSPPQQPISMYNCVKNGQTFINPYDRTIASIDYIPGVDKLTPADKCNIQYPTECRRECQCPGVSKMTFNCYNATTGALVKDASQNTVKVSITWGWRNTDAAWACNNWQSNTCINHGCTA